MAKELIEKLEYSSNKYSLFCEEHFIHTISIISAAYLILQIIYINKLPLGMDEFAGMDTILLHKDGIPYIDFNPYKTTLGYYIQLLPSFFVTDTWDRLIYTKLYIAAINTLAIFFTSYKLASIFNKESAITSTLLLICMSTFLERSSELRVDMLTSIFGLAGLIFLLEKKYIVSGLITGLSFLISQKGIYFLIASYLALAFACYKEAFNKDTLKIVTSYFISSVTPIIIYIIIFWALSDFHSVIQETFIKASNIASSGDIYKSLDKYWYQVISRNPLFSTLTIISIALLWTNRNNLLLLYLCIYGATLLTLCMTHKQPWPYFFVLLIPTCYVLITSLIYIAKNKNNTILFITYLSILTFGIIYPLNRLPININRDNSFQENIIRTSELLLSKYDSYLAGIKLIPSRHHTPASLYWLDRKHLLALKNKGDYNDLIQEMKTSNLKIIVDNYRLKTLPDPLRTYIHTNYALLTGNIMTYSPLIESGINNIDMIFDGYYENDLPNNKIMIDGKTITNNIFYLQKGMHTFYSDNSFRLRLIYKSTHDYYKLKNNIKYQNMFPDIYDY